MDQLEHRQHDVQERPLAPFTAQAQTLLWARERQLARMTTIAEGREVISMQVCGPA